MNNFISESKYHQMFNEMFYFTLIFPPAANVLLALINGEAMLIWID